MRWQLLDCPLVEADVTTHPDYINKFLLPHHLLRSRYIDFDLKLNNCLWSWFHPRRINVQRYIRGHFWTKNCHKVVALLLQSGSFQLEWEILPKNSIFMHIMVVKWSFYSFLLLLNIFFAKRIFYQWNKLCFFLLVISNTLTLITLYKYRWLYTFQLYALILNQAFHTILRVIEKLWLKCK